LNQPLQALSGCAEILAMKINQDHPLYKYAATIGEQIRKMADITRKLQSIAKYETQEYLKGTTIIDIDKASSSNFTVGSMEKTTDSE
ncbi:MAG: hypothetical protein J7M12_02580, partial [Candidatus Hydrogenedentes bacterium]|nr:hypothetical protein [Candidatus Hydrogenedentota bacterium]